MNAEQESEKVPKKLINFPATKDHWSNKGVFREPIAVSVIRKEGLAIQRLETIIGKFLKNDANPGFFIKDQHVNTLYLNGLQLATLSDDFIDILLQFESLNALYLTKNRLTFLPEKICNLKTIQYLDLEGNLLTSLPAVTRCCLIECKT